MPRVIKVAPALARTVPPVRFDPTQNNKTRYLRDLEMLQLFSEVVLIADVEFRNGNFNLEDEASQRFHSYPSNRVNL